MHRNVKTNISNFSTYSLYLIKFLYARSVYAISKYLLLYYCTLIKRKKIKALKKVLILFSSGFKLKLQEIMPD